MSCVISLSNDLTEGWTWTVLLSNVPFSPQTLNYTVKFYIKRFAWPGTRQSQNRGLPEKGMQSYAVDLYLSIAASSRADQYPPLETFNKFP